jgi:hypothetical protein
MHFEYELPDHSRADSIPASEVKYSQGPNRPKVAVGPLGGVKVSGGKNPLNVPEIELRAFAAKMLPPGESASGFVYFRDRCQQRRGVALRDRPEERRDR